ncbi:hypothetical protein KHA95_07345 [Bacillus sp. FJAT-50079]|nr:hypothetical protein [Bacillus sp. FJAT-50079]
MKELGLKCLARMKKYKSYKGTVVTIGPNHLDRRFTADAPNQNWITDSMEFKLFGENLYLSEKLLRTIGSRPTYLLVLEMLKEPLERLQEEYKLLMHSNQD